MAKRAKAEKISAELVLREVAELAMHTPDISVRDKLAALKLLMQHMGLLNVDVPPAPPPVTEDKSQNVHVHFYELPYAEQQKLEALDTLPTRMNPPEIHQGDNRPEGLDD